MMSIHERRRRAAKRGLLYIPLNGIFPNCSAHHISRSYVIHIPIEDHVMPHNVKSKENLKKMNAVAFKYLWDHPNDLKITPIKALNIMKNTR